MIINQKSCVALMAILSMTLAMESSDLRKSRDELDAKCGIYIQRVVKPMVEYVEKIRKEIEVKDQKIMELENALANEKLILKESEEKIAKLIKTELELRSQNKNLSVSVNKRQAEVKILRRNLTNLEQNLNKKSQENKNCELLNADNKKKIADLVKMNEENLKTLSRNERQIDELNKKSDVCELSLRNFRGEYATLQQKLVSRDAEFNNLNKQLNEKKSSENALKQNIFDLNTKNKNLENNIRNCEQINTDKDSKIKKLKCCCKKYKKKYRNRNRSSSGEYDSSDYVIYYRK